MLALVTDAVGVIGTQVAHFWFEFGPRFAPPLTTLTKRRLYTKRFLARPVIFFFFSAFATFGVWFFTLPARAKLPWTLPMLLYTLSNCASGILTPIALEP